MTVESQGHFITLRDEQFVGPDKMLEEELARRRRASPAVLAEMTALEALVARSAPHSSPSPPPPPPPPLRVGGAANVSASLGNDTRRWQSIHNIEDTRYQPEYDKIRILQFQQLLVQLALERIQDLNHLIRNHETDERFRVAYIYCKLKDWVYEMREYFQSTHDHNTLRPLRLHLVYLQVMMRKHIDITYTIELFVHTHHEYLQALMKSMNWTPEDLKAKREQVRKEREKLKAHG